MAKALKGSDPDKGPRMIEGAHSFDKGYESDSSHFSPAKFPGDEERGNRYMNMQNEAVSKDSAKVKRSKFSKIA